jgi:Antitoxin SocA-like, Panacea domain
MPRTDAKRVIIELIRKADGEVTGKTRLFKAFYFAHLNYFEQHPGLLTDWPIARMPQGPGIHKSEELFDQLVKDGYLLIERVHENVYPEYRYRLTSKSNELRPLPEDADLAIQRAMDFVKDKTAVQLSQFTHEYSRSWNEGKSGDILDIYIDVIPDDEYERRKKQLSDLQSQLTM